MSWLGSSCREKKVAPCQPAGHAEGETEAPGVSTKSCGVGCEPFQIPGRIQRQSQPDALVWARRPGSARGGLDAATSGPQTTTLAVIGWTGITAPLVLSGAVNGTVFYGYIQQCVLPTLQPGDILFMDNLSAHKVAGLDELIHSCGAHLIYLPPYSPDFNPIELAWAKVKTILRRIKARTFPDLIEALKQALLAITPQDIQAWFAHCGYAIH